MVARYKNIRVDQPLNLILKRTPTGFIADQVFTKLPVPVRSGILPSVGNTHLRLISTVIIDRAVYKSVPTLDYNLDKTYKARKHAAQDIVTEDDIREARGTTTPYRPRRDVTTNLRAILNNEKEFECSSLVLNNDSYSATNKKALAGNSQWSHASSNPKLHIAEAHKAIMDNGQGVPNTVIIPYRAALYLKSHVSLATAYGSTGHFRPLSFADLPSIFEVKNVLIPRAYYVNNAGVTKFFWFNDAIFLTKEQETSLDTHTFGIQVTLQGAESRIYIREGYNPNDERIQADMSYQFQLLEQDLGYKLSNLLAA